MDPVQIAAKLYDARDSVQRLFGDKYSEKIAPFKDVIKASMAKIGKGEIGTTMEIIRAMQKEDPVGSGMQQLMIFAACVELVEPSF